ncbi:MAG TPA: bifunctional phosphoglucose/phosphomannose isomerase [Saprospiraceae bacterium]|jgi:glucose/mannose-6-phosphate isomerase|nr:bifunctional phosphoglucose/phosphomannose isomerase [Saprospiraceae bacterium]HMX81996.1 bifunctional phosphoglucose/phosphomannose isomerase [Saprospiraceae bacterium]HMX86654.1 bifunctional phosphoglucose/phosphomannose isomerase [Saprospiraceae bacterium]HMZ73772.1 bifunctional phosphoglucose/phosphomannose isomerase [Saprospiraceae bacterium]HNA41528.1 bifunctional phosphoglucose/phosphomannose isomerase [Saprospiraceae bacterium]
MVRMDSLVERFVPQLREALEIGKNAVIRPTAEEIRNVFLSGLGGSGIGGNFVQDFVREELKIPFVVGKSYEIPAFVGAGTLAIASSYSGNTEETLSALDKMLTTGARVVCVASGGKLIDIAKEKGLDYIKVPDNWPSPRACLGYSIVQQLYILHKLGLISERATESINSAAMLLEVEADDIRKKASMIAEMLHGKTPVIYINDRMEAAAIRLRQQINENAKMLCWHHVIPEMNHNELVGWRTKNDNLAVIILRNKNDHARNQVRIDINKEIIGNYTNTLIEVYSKGSNLVEQMLYFVNLGDWISVYLAELRKVDSIEVKVIDFLKDELARY